MHDPTRRMLGEYAEVLDRLKRLAEASTEEIWARRPAPDAWAAAECVAHLNLTSEAYLPTLRRALGEARALDGRPPARPRRDLVGWLIWKGVGPGGRVRMKTPAAFIPEAGVPKADLVADFVRLQGELAACVAEGDGLPIHRVKVASPFDARARYSLYSAFTIVPAHQQRHLGQAERAIGRLVGEAVA